VTFIYAFCAWVLLPWVEHADWYDFYEDGEYAVTLEEGSPFQSAGYITEICRVEYDKPVTFQYLAANELGQSGLGADLVVQWVVDADHDDDGIVGFSDFGPFSNAFGTDDPEFDYDGDGLVGFSDFGHFGRRWGQCNNGTYEVPCG
jgi:hypothetical protein